MNYSKEMRRVTEYSTCLTSAQVPFDSYSHLLAFWINPRWDCSVTSIELGISFKHVKCVLTLEGTIFILNMDRKPYTNNSLYCIIKFLSEDNGETIKQFAQEYITLLLQGVRALWLASIMLSLEDYPFIPLAMSVHYWIFIVWFTGLQHFRVCLWIRDKISE